MSQKFSHSKFLYSAHRVKTTLLYGVQEKTKIIFLCISNQLVFIKKNKCFFLILQRTSRFVYKLKKILFKSYRLRYHKLQRTAFHFIAGFCNTGLMTVL